MGLPDHDGTTYKQLLLNMDVASTAFYQQGKTKKMWKSFSILF
jgi:hypothetical protein